MSRYRRHKRKDNNHAELVKWFRARGALVDDVSDLAGLGYDVIVAYAGQVRMVEIKDGTKPPAHRKLTESEQEAAARWGSKYAVVMSEEDAASMLLAMSRHMEPA